MIKERRAAVELLACLGTWFVGLLKFTAHALSMGK